MTEASRANPLTAGMPSALVPQPSVLVIFGGSGDLSQRKLLPALYNLRLDGVLPANFAVVGIGRREMDDEAFRSFARKGIENFSRQSLDAAHWADFERSLFFHRGSLDDPEMYDGLRKRLDAIDADFGIPGNRIFYLSVPPGLFRASVERLAGAQLVHPADPAGPFTRIIVEKPLGHDLESAQVLNATLAEVFDESQLFRIDHYLGKETVQNLLVLRFGNSIFEPLWNQNFVDHVQITVAEEVGVGTRAGYYDTAGATRDMVQNHILQLLALTAMEPPWSMDADVVRNNALEVLQCLRPVPEERVDDFAVRAQYAPGFNRGEQVPGYLSEADVPQGSTTETYVALKLFIDNWRWAGVPFFLRTGKRLPKRASEIAVRFKEVPHLLFNADPQKPLEANVLAMRIQPDEGLSLRISTKLPGPRTQPYPVKMDFDYGTTFGDQSPEAYERLLLDVMAGDATLFMRRDVVETAWARIMPFLDAWSGQPGPLPQYEAGSWGPKEADALIATTGNRWRTL